jgi:hypothetical protein
MESAQLTAEERSELLSVIQQSRAVLLENGNDYDTEALSA